MCIRIQRLDLVRVTALVTMLASACIHTGARADAVESTGGTFVLALSGLEIDLPALADSNVYLISGSFALGEGGGYDGRDVIDEAAGGELVAGTWISLGYFDAGAPADVVAGVGLTDGWTSQGELWGTTWSFAGGIHEFTGELGSKPAMVACTQLGEGKALLIHRFFLTRPTTMTQAEMLAAFEQASAPRAAWTSYSQQRVGAVEPMRRPEIRDRGDKSPSRWEYLEPSLLELLVPDDGYVWLVHSDPEAGVDRLNRMAPALPEVSIEILTAPGQMCGEIFDAIPLEKRAVQASNIPDGWTPGPQLVLESDLELTLCHATGAGVVIVGIFQGPSALDVSHLASLLTAIAEAADVP